MNKGTWLLIALLALAAGELIFFEIFNPVSVFFGVIVIIIAYIVLCILFLCKRHKKVVKKLQNRYTLEVLENTTSNVYAIKNYGNDGFDYYFSYINENGEKVTCLQSVVDVQKTDEEPYVEIYKNEYKPKGLLDFLFYSKSLEEYYSVIYVLYLNDENVKSK